ncbi:MAG: hypothetical protein QW420_02880 [Candidatus Caldarchaeum sp.]
MEFLVELYADKQLLRKLLTPKIVFDDYGYSIIPQRLRCSHCEEDLPVTKPGGYALFDYEGELWELLCENCRQRFHRSTPTYESLEQAMKR